MKKFWGIRHLRYFVALIGFNVWWERYGQYMGIVPNPADMQHLDNIWNGKA